MQSNFRLVMRSGPSVGKVYPLDKNEMFVGRDLSNDIVINDPEISRRHARLMLQGNAYVLEDLASTNGSFVNGQRLMGPAILRPGDTIIFGERMSMVFESSDYDQDATLVSPASRPDYGNPPPGQAQIYNAPPSYTPPQPAYPPQQQASYAPVSPQPVRQPATGYAGQVPADYDPNIPPERRLPLPWIVAGAIVLLLCLCLAVGAWFAPESFWCLFPVWPAGYCP